MVIPLSDMVLIPGGTFIMGSTEGNIDEQPPHEVEISPFYLDERVVTNREFQAFILANPEWSKTRITPDKADTNYLNLWDDDYCPEELLDFCVINVSQLGTLAFCKWVGKRLPTEAEWEFAAGGPERFKWSLNNEFRPEDYVFNRDAGQPRGETPASHRPNGYGLYDMSGLVWEWTQDAYSTDFYARSPRVNPVNRRGDEGRFVVRGGSAYFDNPSYLRVHQRGRNAPQACHEDYGFRCARDV
jgi:formylglycine-generating enzyme required for sulfatase activity